MQIEKKYPPNYDAIKNYFDFTDSKPVFAYGDTIYNPHDIELSADLEFHENVHRNQQEKYSSPDIWWTNYCMDKDFRRDQEVEAFALQYDFIKRHTPYSYYSHALDEFAEKLSSPLYDLGITKSQAQTLIRKYEKEN